MPKQTLQHFELHVLLAMLREGGETYSVPLVVALEKRMERPVAQAAVFIALSRLEKKGLVTSRLDERRWWPGAPVFQTERPGAGGRQGDPDRARAPVARARPSPEHPERLTWAGCCDCCSAMTIGGRSKTTLPSSTNCAGIRTASARRAVG